MKRHLCALLLAAASGVVSAEPDAMVPDRKKALDAVWVAWRLETLVDVSTKFCQAAVPESAAENARNQWHLNNDAVFARFTVLKTRVFQVVADESDPKHGAAIIGALDSLMRRELVLPYEQEVSARLTALSATDLKNHCAGFARDAREGRLDLLVKAPAAHAYMGRFVAVGQGR